VLGVGACQLTCPWATKGLRLRLQPVSQRQGHARCAACGQTPFPDIAVSATVSQILHHLATPLTSFQHAVQCVQILVYDVINTAAVAVTSQARGCMLHDTLLLPPPCAGATAPGRAAGAAAGTARWPVHSSTPHERARAAGSTSAADQGGAAGQGQRRWCW
jgi:hypothetical protein